ncbi:MAG: YceI family protein, partial [Mariprofundus sp.]
MKLKPLILSLILALGFTTTAQATEKYLFDIKGQHAFIQFKVKHLGYSWLIGNFKTFDGSFTFDKSNNENNSVKVEIDLASIDSNHAERDKHLRSADFFDVAKFPKATFNSNSYEAVDETHGVVKGTLTLRGVSKQIAINVTQIGTGKDPWGGYRRGFEG